MIWPFKKKPKVDYLTEPERVVVEFVKSSLANEPENWTSVYPHCGTQSAGELWLKGDKPVKIDTDGYVLNPIFFRTESEDKKIVTELAEVIFKRDSVRVVSKTLGC